MPIHPRLYIFGGGRKFACSLWWEIIVLKFYLLIRIFNSKDNNRDRERILLIVQRGSRVPRRARSSSSSRIP